ncbi:MAG: 16S rRNA (guanine(527)-N(7))-methyltransferase RsmG [Anaerolineae bacterium]|nr:16S rRNA (guanine(527)-N(7))-methyltransferase RsmG [Phycisphaerae bacterium]
MDPIVLDIAGRAGVSLSTEQIGKLEEYLNLLLAANERMNLTRITDRAAAEVQHIGDSLTLLPYLPKGPHALADVGTGGGVPGIPLAIARPDAQVTLIESTKKKAVFLRETVAQLGLTNVTVDDRRAEELGKRGKKTRESFDIVAFRAVATMIWLVEWGMPLTKKGGKLLAMKGPKGREELAGVQARTLRFLGGGEPIVHEISLPGTDSRIVVQIDKVGHSDKRFPRDPTTAKGQPMK